MKFWFYFFAFFFAGVTIQMVKDHQLDFVAYAGALLMGLIVSSVIILNQTYTKSRDLIKRH
jgi:hypothetical protein